MESGEVLWSGGGDGAEDRIAEDHKGWCLGGARYLGAPVAELLEESFGFGRGLLRRGFGAAGLGRALPAGWRFGDAGAEPDSVEGRFVGSAAFVRDRGFAVCDVFAFRVAEGVVGKRDQRGAGEAVEQRVEVLAVLHEVQVGEELAGEELHLIGRAESRQRE